MNSGATWNERGLSPELYQAAREAARRAGISVEEWLDSTFGNGSATKSAPHEDAAPSLRGARLSDTVAKLNARLEQLTSGRAAPPDAGRYAATEPKSPPLAPDPLGIDQAVAEIAARQRALDEAPAAPAAVFQPTYQAPAAAPPGPDFANLERQLTQITAQIESLRQPSGVEDAIAALRADLADIAHALNEAVPRRALEGLQAEMHALAERIERSYGHGDASALQGIEHRLNEVYAALNAMTPAEGLGALDERVSDLARKVDSVATGSSDPEMLRYLEAAINELRELSHGVASAEGVAALAGDVQALGARIDHIAATTGASGLDSLAQRVNELTYALDTRVETMGPMPQNIAALVQSLTDKLNGADGASRDQAAFEQLERRIMSIADRIETADQRTGDLSAIERGIQQLTLQVREAREESVVTAERVARAVISDLPRGDNESVRRDLETLHAHQAESDQRTQDTLEALHETLERLVDRLAGVETGLHASYAERPEPMRAAEPPHVPEPPRAQESLRAEAPMAHYEPAPEPRAAPPALPEQIPPAPAAPVVRAAPFVHVQRTERPPIDPDLPADTPLEPGTGAARGRSPAERIAASEAALGPALGTLKREGEVTGKANFIAAARRAAQAAASEGGVVEPPKAEEHKTEETPTSLIGRFLANRRRALTVGVSALLVLYGTMQLVGMFGGWGDAPEPPRNAPSQTQAPEPRKMAAPVPAPASAPAPALSAPPTAAEPERQSAVQPLVAPTPSANLIAPTPLSAAPAAEVTGSVKQQPPLNIAALARPDASAPQPGTLSDKLPAAIAGPALRAAAVAGNPAAEYEIGVRYSQGRGVPVDLELAALWFENAANHGLAPAQYRLGSLYEKGLGVKKDLNKARALYLQAADKGNATAIHNLAVLYAEGIDGKPDYQVAAQWFRKSASRGVADSQYNLGIIYARGIGVDQNLAESYKWFALAAQQGDQKAAEKRDDVARRLDQQSLVAARLAVQTFTADPPPDEAVNVKAPPGGWDKATSQAPAKPAALPRRKQQS